MIKKFKILGVSFQAHCDDDGKSYMLESVSAVGEIVDCSQLLDFGDFKNIVDAAKDENAS
jgi:hypothetical protein